MIVYHLKKHDMIVTLLQDKHQEPVVQIALGTEVRILSLAEFTDFWLAMVEEGRKATSAYLKTLGSLPKSRTKEKRNRPYVANSPVSKNLRSETRCAVCGAPYLTK